MPLCELVRLRPNKVIFLNSSHRSDLRVYLPIYRKKTAETMNAMRFDTKNKCFLETIHAFTPERKPWAPLAFDELAYQ